MKKLKPSMRTVLTLLACFALSAFCGSCQAKKRSQLWTQASELDSVVTTCVGDSIVNLMVSAKKVIVSEMSFADDTLQYVNERKLNASERDLLLFLFLDKDMMSPPPSSIYARFFPQVCFSFIGKKGNKLTLSFDLGISRWSLANSQEKMMAKGQICDKRMIRLCHFLLPGNETIDAIYNFKTED